METTTRIRFSDFDRKTYLGIRRGVAKALAEHKRLGQSIVVSREGEIVWIPPEEITVPTDEEIERDYEALFGKDLVINNGDPSR